jgi:hypothetical protein
VEFQIVYVCEIALLNHGAKWHRCEVDGYPAEGGRLHVTYTGGGSVRTANALQ